MNEPAVCFAAWPASQGKDIEVDGEKETCFEILKDGTKAPVDSSTLSLAPEAWP